MRGFKECYSMKKKIYKFLGQKQAVFFEDNREEAEIDEIFNGVVSPFLEHPSLVPITGSYISKVFASHLSGIATTLPIVEGQVSEAMEYVDFPVCSEEELEKGEEEGKIVLLPNCKPKHNYASYYEARKILKSKIDENSITEEEKQKLDDIILILEQESVILDRETRQEDEERVNAEQISESVVSSGSSVTDTVIPSATDNKSEKRRNKR